MNKITGRILMIALWFLCFQCNSNFNSGSEMMKWINDPANGLKNEKTIGDLILSVKYLPPEYLVFRERNTKQNYTKNEIDSLLKEYKYSRTFLVNIGPTEDKEEMDIMYSNVANYSEYSARSQEMNFEMGEYISLNISGKKYKPVLVTMENVYSLKNSRNLYVVFSPQEDKNELVNSEDLDLVFEDPFFKSGITHFKFAKDQIDNIPEVKFLTRTNL